MTKDSIYILLTPTYVPIVHNIVVLLQTASNSQTQHLRTKLVHKTTSTNLDIQRPESIVDTPSTTELSMHSILCCIVAWPTFLHFKLYTTSPKLQSRCIIVYHLTDTDTYTFKHLINALYYTPIYVHTTTRTWWPGQCTYCTCFKMTAFQLHIRYHMHSIWLYVCAWHIDTLHDTKVEYVHRETELSM